MYFLKKWLNLDKKYVDNLTLASTMGLHLVTGTLVGGAMGYFLDRWLDTKPWFLFVGFFFGVASGYRMIYQDYQKLKRQEEREGKHDGQHPPQS